MTIELEIAPEEHLFDRLPEFDPRSLEYPIRTLVAAKERRSYTWRVPVALDQGAEGACVGFGWAHELAARPKEDPTITNAHARSIYLRAQQLDAWPGENYEGSSVIAGAKAVMELGRLREYRWALGPGAAAAENDLALAIGYKGPAVMGTYWYEGMMRPDVSGYLRPTGKLVGGHCYLVYGYNLRLGYKVWNSWGTGFYGLISQDDMITLLSNEGEACIPVLR
jgi:hypothetical protein